MLMEQQKIARSIAHVLNWNVNDRNMHHSVVCGYVQAHCRLIAFMATDNLLSERLFPKLF